MSAHGWRLVAPWYRWERRDGAEPGRAAGAARPALHKYVSTAFVADFLADPQHSVAFGTVDERQDIEAISDVPLPGDARKRRRFLATTRTKPSGVRKLFQPAHQRFYIVALGLHCDEPGFPKVDPAAVAESGFVVRRRRVAIPVGEEAQAAALLRDLTTAQAVARAKAGFADARARARVLHPFGNPARARVTDPGAAALAAQQAVERSRRALRTWAAEVGVDRRTEGWVATGEGSFGAWVPLADTPEELVERTYPLRPLTAPPKDPGHAARDGTIVWGVVPTASDEITSDGAARFTELAVYEIRAYARPRCGDCPGPLVWSASSAAFHLAAFHDPDGCAQRPIEVRLPDFAQLEASTALPSVQLSAPPRSSFVFAENGEIPKSGSLAAAREICFFAIPLITIVAVFVLKLFLPIVTFVFGLFWMLKLKFCLPPSLQLEADLTAALDVVPGKIAGSLTVDIDLFPGLDQGRIETALRTGLGPAPPAGPLTEDYTNDPLVELLARQGMGRQAGTPFPVFSAAPTYVAAVTREQVRPPARAPAAVLS